MKLLLTAIFILSAFTLAKTQDDESASVSGRVTSLRGDVLENVEVQFFALEGISGNSPKETLVKSTFTDKDGNYKINGLPYGQYHVYFSLESFDHTEVWRFYLWRKADRILDIGIPIGYTHALEEINITGRVRETKNSELRDATVTLVNAFNPGETQQVRTDKNGKYEITLIQPGQYILTASKPGYAISSLTTDLGSGAKVDLNFNLNVTKQKLIDDK